MTGKMYPLLTSSYSCRRKSHHPSYSHDRGCDKSGSSNDSNSCSGDYSGCSKHRILSGGFAKLFDNSVKMFLETRGERFLYLLAELLIEPHQRSSEQEVLAPHSCLQHLKK